jgi:hypothetical protein
MILLENGAKTGCKGVFNLYHAVNEICGFETVILKILPYVKV